jgi:hypothetical protein
MIKSLFFNNSSAYPDVHSEIISMNKLAKQDTVIKSLDS